MDVKANHFLGVLDQMLQHTIAAPRRAAVLTGALEGSHMEAGDPNLGFGKANLESPIWGRDPKLGSEPPTQRPGCRGPLQPELAMPRPQIGVDGVTLARHPSVRTDL